MNIKNCLMPLLLGGLLAAAVHAEPVAKIDPVLASCQRLIQHQPGPIAPTVSPGMDVAPLRNSVTTVLREKRERPFHILAKLEAVVPPSSRRFGI